jgi:hypothetical protein
MKCRNELAGCGSLILILVSAALPVSAERTTGPLYLRHHHPDPTAQ